MKIWFGFGSEHSSKIRMIGTFKSASAAAEAERELERLMEMAVNAVDFDKFEENPMAWYMESEVRSVLRQLHIDYFSPDDLRQLIGEHRLERSNTNDSEVVLWTDEYDLGVFVKFLISRSARIEVYSAHDYPESAAELT